MAKRNTLSSEDIQNIASKLMAQREFQFMVPEELLCTVQYMLYLALSNATDERKHFISLISIVKNDLDALAIDTLKTWDSKPKCAARNAYVAELRKENPDPNILETLIRTMKGELNG